MKYADCSRCACVGLQKIAAANSNTATRHILQAQLYITLSTCENIALRLADALNYPLTAQALKQSISTYNVGTLEELATLQIHDFGIFLDLMPDEEERAKLENNIQTALSAGLIGLDDAIDIRNISNIKTANEFLKVRQAEKAKRDQEAQQANIAAQAQANAQLAEQTALAETQKQQVLTEQKIQLEQAKAEFKAKGLPDINIGSGVNTGTCIVGNMGSEMRLDYSVIGDSVNLAARLEATTRNYKDENGKVTPLLYSSFTQEKLKNIQSVEVDKIKVKGKEELITIYKPI